MISAIGSPATPSTSGQPAGVELAVEVRDHRRERDDHHDLGQLRRLQLERADLEPGLGALRSLPEPGHDQQQQQQDTPP